MELKDKKRLVGEMIESVWRKVFMEERDKLIKVLEEDILNPDLVERAKRNEVRYDYDDVMRQVLGFVKEFKRLPEGFVKEWKVFVDKRFN